MLRLKNQQSSMTVSVTSTICPYCEHDEISTAVPCRQCSEPKPNDFEPFCDQCKINIRKIYEFIYEMQVVAGWDKELLDDMLTEYLEVK